jgi:hypothetical protein
VRTCTGGCCRCAETYKLGRSYSLRLNTAKCEVISKIGLVNGPILAAFQQFTPDTATLLGAPLGSGRATDEMLADRCLLRAISRLETNQSYDALVLLKNSLSTPRLQFMLRAAPCMEHPLLVKYDDILRKATRGVCNIDLSDDQLLQASLPVRSGGLGIRRVSSLAPSALTASAAGTSELQACILIKSGTSHDDPACDQTKQQWIAKSNEACPTDI